MTVISGEFLEIILTAPLTRQEISCESDMTVNSGEFLEIILTAPLTRQEISCLD